MKKLKTLQKVLTYDRLLRFTIDLLSGIRSEVRADIEEVKILSESFLNNKEREEIGEFLERVNSRFLKELDEVLDRIYDHYEVFNFDITFLSGIPEEVEREIERLNLIELINRELEKLGLILEEACCDGNYGNSSRAVLTPFLVYCRLINHAIEFNKKFENFLTES
jgi:hypothetical protein